MAKTWDKPYLARAPTSGFGMLDTANMDLGWDRMPALDARFPTPAQLPSLEKMDRQTLFLSDY